MKKKTLITFLPLFLIWAFAGPARAQGNIHYGKLEIHPGLNLNNTYSDNVNQASDANQNADENPAENILQVTPGLELRFPTSEHLFRLGYNLSVFNFIKRSETDLKNSVMGSIDLNFPIGVVLRLSDNFSQRVFPTVQLQDQTGILKHWENNGFVEAGYTLTQRWSVSGRYKNQLLRFEDYSAYDRDINSGGAALFMRVLAKVSLFGEVWFGKVGYKESASTGQDATYFQGSLGLSGRVSPKTNFSLKAGFENRSYSNSDAFPATNAPIVSLTLEERPTTRLAFSLTGARSVAESVYENNSHYISTGGEATVSLNLFRMLAVGSDFSYYLLQYEKANNAGDKRTDKILEITPSVKVDITRWLRASAGYTLRNRASNVDNYEFQENRIGVSLNAIL